jgi:hypothetical protein
LNPNRPSLIISATDYSDNSNDTDIFTFTREDFEDKLYSNIGTFELGRAVAASSAYPGFFNYSTLAVWTPDADRPEKYKHLFDGGASDNLAVAGLEKSLRASLLPDRAQPRQLIFLVVDAQNGFGGVSADQPDPRNTVLGIVDLNFLDAYDTLMERTYASTLSYLPERLKLNLRVPIDPTHVHVEHVALLTLNRQWFGYGETSGTGGLLGQSDTLVGTATYVRRPSNDPYGVHKSLLWRKIKRIDTGYGLANRQQACLRAAAYLLVRDKVDDLTALLNLAPSAPTISARAENFQQQYNTCVLPIR